MVAAIKKELFLRNRFLPDQTLKSLYFGGGTPSVLSVDELKGIIDEVLKYFSFASDIEITLEANPDDLSSNYLRDLAKSEVNRLSIGTQSFFDEELKFMNRAHSASEADSSVKTAQDFGFHNISIDLIYGSPVSNLAMWKTNLQKAVDLQIPHISSYALTVEPNTALENWISKGQVEPPRDADQNDEFFFMCQFLKDNGFDHYEISNFAKPGYHSLHNSAYWEYQPYLGLGPSAHSYNGSDCRSWNVAHNPLYIKTIDQDQLPLEYEILSETDRHNEMLMIGLRTAKGVNMGVLKTLVSDDIYNNLLESMQPKIKEGILKMDAGYLKIPEAHWFMADGIAASLFVV